MNNIESIKEDYNIGDPIRIVCSLGIKEGYIVDFREDRIKIRPFEEGRKAVPLAVVSSAARGRSSIQEREEEDGPACRHLECYGAPLKEP